jgi:hypothetical protein
MAVAIILSSISQNYLDLGRLKEPSPAFSPVLPSISSFMLREEEISSCT